MSEPASFYVRVSIDKPQLDAFLQAAPSQPAPNGNWDAWWNSRAMYGATALADELRAWPMATNGAIVDEWLGDKQSCSFSRYDEENRVWEFGIIMCTDNYAEILPLLVFCQSLQPYRNASAQGDVGIVYPFFWGDDGVMAYFTYGRDGFELAPQVGSTGDVPEETMTRLATRLEAMWNALEADGAD